jgi:hypothetical protein
MENITLTIENVLKLYEQSEWGQGLFEEKHPYEISIENYKGASFLNDEREFYSAIKKDIYKHDFEGIKLELNVMDENYSEILYKNTYSSVEHPELLNLLPDELKNLIEKIDNQTLFDILDDELEYDELFEYLDDYSVENENPNAQFDIYFEGTNKIFIDTNSNYMEFDDYDFRECYYKDVPEMLTYKTVEYFNNKSPNEDAEIYLTEKMRYFDFIKTHDLLVSDEEIDFSKLLGISNINEIQKAKVEQKSLEILKQIANENEIEYFIDDERVLFSESGDNKTISGYKNALDFVNSIIQKRNEANKIDILRLLDRDENIKDYISNSGYTFDSTYDFTDGSIVGYDVRFYDNKKDDYCVSIYDNKVCVVAKENGENNSFEYINNSEILVNTEKPSLVLALAKRFETKTLRLNGEKINDLMAEFNILNERYDNSDFDGSRFEGEFDKVLQDYGFFRFAIVGSVVDSTTMLIANKDYLNSIIKDNYSCEIMYECEKEWIECFYNETEVFNGICEPIINDLDEYVHDFAIYLNGLDNIFDEYKKLGYVFGKEKFQELDDFKTQKKVSSSDCDELFNADNSTQDISDTMGEIEKSDKKVEQRLG